MKSSKSPIGLALTALVLLGLHPWNAFAYDAETFVFRRPPVTGIVAAGPGGARSVRGTIFPAGSGSLSKTPGIGALEGGPDYTLEVTLNVAGCDSPLVFVKEDDFEIVWGSECVFPGDSVLVHVTTESGPLEFDEGEWVDGKGNVVDPVDGELVPCSDRNNAPHFTDPTPDCGSTIPAERGSKLAFTVTAADSNASNDVTVSVSGLPPGATMAPSLPTSGNPVSSDFNWTPTNADAGNHVITFTATDECGAERSCAITVAVENGDPDCSGARARQAVIWSPNHKMVPVRIVGVTDPDGDPVRIVATSVTQDEPLVSEGSGLAAQVDGDGPQATGALEPERRAPAQTCPDAEIRRGVASVRAEREGGGNGRVYTIHFTATDGQGGECTGTVTVCVPHDQSQPLPCMDDGQTVNSLGPCPRSANNLVSPEEPTVTRVNVVEAAGGKATFEYSLVEDGDVTLRIFDVAGRRLATVERSHRIAGTYRATWNGDGAARGIYFYRLTAGRRSYSKAFFLAK